MRKVFAFGLAAAVVFVAATLASPAFAQYATPEHDTPFDQPRERADQTPPPQQPEQTQQPQQTFDPGPPAAGGPDPAEDWARRPALTASHNALLGRWRYVGVSASNLGAQQTNAMAGMLGPQYAQMAQNMASSMYGSTCQSLFSGGSAGLIEFRGADMVGVNNDGGATVISRVEYRGDGASVIVLPKDIAMARIFAFDINGDRATARALGCTLQRVSATPGSASTPGHAGAASVPSAQSASLVINASVRVPGPGGNFAPVTGAPVVLSTRSLDEALASVGLRQPTPVVAWLTACQARAPACAQGMQALAANPAAKGATDAQGHLTLNSTPTGHFFVVCIGGTVAGQTLIWSVPIDIGAGANQLGLSDANSLYIPPPPG
ncbi:MAG: hypothetical protein ABUL42_00030 [Terricaulis silvestris]